MRATLTTPTAIGTAATALIAARSQKMMIAPQKVTG
jgi:hypothetical protein